MQFLPLRILLYQRVPKDIKLSVSVFALGVLFSACSTTPPSSYSRGVTSITIDDGKRFSSSSYRVNHNQKINEKNRYKPPPSSYYEGLAKYGSGHYQDAIRILMPLAKKGFREAQTIIGLMYATGNGIVRDDIKAVGWFRKAANLGDADAQTNLGYMYANGLGITINKKKALKWYLRAAEQDHEGAKANLAAFYNNESPSLFLDPSLRFQSNQSG